VHGLPSIPALATQLWAFCAKAGAAMKMETKATTEIFGKANVFMTKFLV
jgi:hypothetical protein